MTRPCLHPPEDRKLYPNLGDWFRCARCGVLLHRREVRT